MRRRAARGQRVESSFDAEIDALQIAKQRLADDRKRARKVLMNARRRRSRLKNKVSKLSNSDLFDPAKMRDLEEGLSSGTVGGDAAEQESNGASGAANSAEGSELLRPSERERK